MKCPRCQNEMNKDSYIIDQAIPISDLVIIRKNDDLTKTVLPIGVEVCEECGHIEMFIERVIEE